GEHVFAGVPREDERDADPILEMAVQQVLASERRQHASREVGEPDGGIERPGVVGAQLRGRVCHAVACSASSPSDIVAVPANRPLSIARIVTSCPATSARKAPTVACSRARCANGSNRYQRIAFSWVSLAISASVTS